MQQRLEKQLLNRAKAFGFHVGKNVVGRWVIKGLIGKKLWVLQQNNTNLWLMTFDELSQMPLSTRSSLSALIMFSRYT